MFTVAQRPRYMSRRRSYRPLLALVLAAISLPALITAWGIWLSPQDAPVPVDAIFVPNGDPDFQRTAKAAELYRRGLARWLVLSGEGIGGDSSLRMAEQAKRWGVPAPAILIEPHATSTYENAALTAPVLRSHGIRRVLIVSSPYHLRRMKLAARAAWPGISVLTYRDEERFEPWWWQQPDARRTVASETNKLIGYLLLGYVTR